MSNFAYSGDFDDEEPEPEPGPAVWCVCPFLVDRAFGGHEEGGWWFDFGEPQLENWLPLPEFFGDQEKAIEARDKMQALLDVTVNEGRRPISSVLSEGVYQAEITRGWPKPYPERTPHYE